MVSQSTELSDLQQARDAIARAVHQRSTSLDLSRKELTELPAEIGQLTKLQTLHLRGNRLAALPEWLGRLTNLRSLDLRYNKLTALPESLGQLTNLRRLYLGNNQLTALRRSGSAGSPTCRSLTSAEAN